MDKGSLLIRVINILGIQMCDGYKMAIIIIIYDIIVIISIIIIGSRLFEALNK